MEEPIINEAEEAGAPAPGLGSRILAELLDWFDTLSGCVLIIIVFFVLVSRLSTVDGDSMLPTLHNGDKLMVTDLMYTPAHNDIVVLWAEGLPNRDGTSGKAIVKRVIGIPGDTIRIDFDAGIVYRNDKELTVTPNDTDGTFFEDGHAIRTTTTERLSMIGSVDVPEGYVFVMGDNRNNSTDSRDNRVGLVNVNDIIGKAYLRVVPPESFGGLV